MLVVFLCYITAVLYCHVNFVQVFLSEYAGPLVAYLLFYIRPSLVYGAAATEKPIAPVVQ